MTNPRLAVPVSAARVFLAAVERSGHAAAAAETDPTSPRLLGAAGSSRIGTVAAAALAW